MPPEAGASSADRRMWSMHEAEPTDGVDNTYWWCESIKVSTYVRHLEVQGAADGFDPKTATDSQLFIAMADRQIRECYKLCQVCASPAESPSNPFFVCATCLRHCHHDCSSKCKEVIDSAVWPVYAPYLRTCFVCGGRVKEPGSKFADGSSTPMQLSARGAHNRLRSVALPIAVRESLSAAEALMEKAPEDAERNMAAVRSILRDMYCPGGAHRYWRIGRSGKGGEGVFAAERVPAFTRVGIMPGYPDPLAGEQTERGRPQPKYALSDINAADYYNVPFPEFRDCPAWCVNEPGVGEKSNCAWLQEPVGGPVEHGRLSVVTVKELQKGEEALLSYGPVYPRDYPYAYDAYSFHPQERAPAGVYELWYYSSRESEAESKGHVRLNPATGGFEEWVPE
eukprot:TRINITY_DN4008_c3_g1_i2.p1 TRINITY_DN4008_c3_g1~~TRINITY_DN4008_c3_g1_i2.p1  ORF type:complete len:396 (+),score=95.27 TRINITY_DN4008_c3_g1_i2:74-1261(+)